MVLRLVALSSNGFTEIVIDDEGAVKLSSSSPDTEQTVVLNGLTWPTREVDVPHLDREDCFFMNPSGEALGSSCGRGLLHHYTTAETAAKILDSGCLLLSPYKNANDDHESAVRWFDIYCPDESDPPGLATDLSRQLDRMLRSHWAFASFSNDQFGWDSDVIPPLHESDGWQHPGMWAHYGGRHRKTTTGKLPGAVLVFERRELVDAVKAALPRKALIFGNVRYARQDDQALLASMRVSLESLRNAGLETYVGWHLSRFWREYHLTKFAGWSYEREARVSVNTAPDEPCFVPFQRSLKYVLLGEGVEAEFISAAERLTIERGAEVCGVRWRNGMPVLVPPQVLKA